MSFGEKLREIRTQENLTQQEMADRIGVSLRTLKSYELGGETLPRYRKIYHKIAEEFNVDVNYLLTEGGDDFILSAGEKYGSRGIKGAQELIDNARALFAGGELSEDDKK